MCGFFLFRFSQDRRIQDWFYLNWIFPFRFFRFRFGWPWLLQNGILNGTKLPIGKPDTLPDHISMLLQLLHSGTDTVHAILANPGKTFGCVVPTIRQGQH